MTALDHAVPDIPGDPFGSPEKGNGSSMPSIDQIMQNEPQQEQIVKKRPDAKSIDELVAFDDDELLEFEKEIRCKIQMKLEAEEKRMK